MNKRLSLAVTAGLLLLIAAGPEPAPPQGDAKACRDFIEQHGGEASCAVESTPR
ncbi:hypothetical protein [Actinoplanes solisilvae]|uniref:hypothetical protein n=1 Tax=Actinoplanes solisilvae TaxID=2486853 RepID=UPI0013E3325D|nr:hypothetical protein [Actinoplanes solisilvae]